MPKLFSAQTTSSDLPLILVAGSGTYIEQLIGILLATSKVIHISQTALAPIASSEQYTFVKALDADMINRLEERIEYAIIYVQQNQDKQIVQDILPKVKKDGGKICFVFDVRSVHEFYDVILASKEIRQASFLILGDIFSPEIPTTFLSAIINRALVQKKITLSGNDLYPIFPIALKDAIDATLTSVFGDLKKTRLFFLFYEVPQTVISLVHVLRKIEPELAIEYGKEEQQQLSKDHENILNEIFTKTLFKPEYFHIGINGFEKGVDEFITGKTPELAKKPITIPTPTLERNPRRITNSRWASVLLISFLTFIFINVLFVILGILLGKQAASSFRDGNYPTAKQSAQESLMLFNISHPVLNLSATIVGTLLPQMHIQQEYNDLQKGLSLTNELLNTTLPIFNNISSGISSASLENLSANLLDVYFSLEQLSTSSITQLQTLRQQPYLRFVSLLPTLPDILGFDGNRTYLLLFQDNGELRPNGGFVGSVGQLTMRQGKVEQFVLHDVYDPDGQLKIHVEPNYIIRRYLQPNLYLRDSTFNLDFQDSATQSAMLYQAETGVHVDGVIAIDFEVLKQIIEAVGPISLPSYHVALNANNTFDFLQNTIESNKFAGSRQKQDVLTSLFNQLLVDATHGNNKLKVARLIPQLMINKHILFAFGNPAIQQIYNLEDLGGTMQDTRDITANQMNDFLSINEANIGVNKANTAVSRSVQYSVSLNGGSADSTTKINFSNEFNSLYKSYIRVVTPLHSKLIAISINGVKQNIVPAITDFRVYEAKGFKPPSGLEVDTTTVHNLTAFGFIIQVPAHQTQEVEVDYTNGATVPTGSLIKYSLLYIKQPGTLSYPVTFNVHYPSGYIPNRPMNTQLGNDLVSQTTTLTTDYTFPIVLHQ